MYEFRDHWADAWGLNLIVAKNEVALADGVRCCCDAAMSCCHHLKTEALKQVVRRQGFDGLLVGIRRDEHGVRAKERYFSPRDAEFRWESEKQPVELPGLSPDTLPAGAHLRVHPLLHWTEIDVWAYTRLERLPTVRLYYQHQGQRYRSLGCEPATSPVPSEADSIDAIIAELRTTQERERSGRTQDKESPQRMERLRSLGYL